LDISWADKGFFKEREVLLSEWKAKGSLCLSSVKGIERLLGGEFLPEGGTMNTRDILFMNKLPIEGLMEVIKRVVDPRSRKVDVYGFDELISGWLMVRV
jgi:hypothetical protein